MGIFVPILRIGGLVGAIVAIATGNYSWLIACVLAWLLSIPLARAHTTKFDRALEEWAVEAVGPTGAVPPAEVRRALWESDNSRFEGAARAFVAQHPDRTWSVKALCYQEACRAWALEGSRGGSLPY